MPGDAPKDPAIFIVQDDTPCSECGYSLKGLPLNGVCPECRASVTKSLAVVDVPKAPFWHFAAVVLYVFLYLNWFMASFITVVPRGAAVFHRNWLIGGTALVVIGFVLALLAFDRRRQIIPAIIVMLTLLVITLNA